VVVEIEGKLVGGPGSEGFHEMVKRLLEDGERRFVFNLEKTPWASSQGVGLLIGAMTSVTRAGGKMVLANGCDRIEDILKVTRLNMIFDCYNNVERAVREVLAEGGGGAARAGATRTMVG
jgi:anti-sigma B factor antagonist